MVITNGDVFYLQILMETLVTEFEFGRPQAMEMAECLGKTFARPSSWKPLTSALEWPLDVHGQSAAHCNEVSGRFARRGTYGRSDWYRLLHDLNGAIAPAGGRLRKKTVLLREGEPWMWWQAPPERLEERTRAVVDLLVSRGAEIGTFRSVYPSLILLHPFEDGNSRTALWFLRTLNNVRHVVDAERVHGFAQQALAQREETIAAMAAIRIARDIAPFMRSAGQWLAD